MTEINIKLGGAAGQGLHRSGHILAKMFVRGGYNVFAIQDAMSRIRGGHNFFQLRVKDGPVAAMTSRVDLVAAPPTGIGCPFISAGGTRLITMAAATSLILSVTAHRPAEPIPTQQTETAARQTRDRRGRRCPAVSP